MKKSKTEEWLEETGYRFAADLGLYYFRFRDGEYGAYNSFDLDFILDTPLKHIKEIHEHFLERAERNEEF
jgi:hypothetical protein